MDLKEAVKTIESYAANCAEGDRYIVVLDRGWIFVGKLTRDEKGICTLGDCSNIRKWVGGCGFGGLTQGAKTAEATLDKCRPIRFREDASIFVVPVSEGWEDA